MGKPKAPKAPDYAAAAKQQGEENINSSIATNYLNQINQTGPEGSMEFSYSKPGEGGHYLPNGTYIPTTSMKTTLSPEQQKLYDQNTQISTSLNEIAQQGIGYVGDTANKPYDQSQFPGLKTSVGGSGGIQTQLGNIGPIQGQIGDAGPIQGQIADAGDIQSQLGRTNYKSAYDFSGIGAMPSSSDFAAQRDQITNAMMERLQPFIDRDRSALQNKLANQGIGLGSEAYQTDNTIFDKGVNDQRIAALLAGSGEQQRFFQNAMGIRGQGVGEAMAQGNIANEAAAGEFGQGLAAGNFANNAQGQRYQQNANSMEAANSAQTQKFMQMLAGGDFTNQAAQLKLQEEMARGNFNNQGQQQMFQQGLAGGEFENQARSQAIQEADYFRNQPLNMLNALRTGNQVSMPQFGNWATGTSPDAAPVYAAVNDRYNAQMDAYNAKMQGYGAMMGGLGALGGGAVGKWG